MTIVNAEPVRIHAPAGPERVLPVMIIDWRASAKGVMLLGNELPSRPMMTPARKWVEVEAAGTDRTALEAAAARASALGAGGWVMRLPVFNRTGELYAHAASFEEALAVLERNAANPPTVPEPVALAQPEPDAQLALALPTPPRPTF